MAKKFTIRAEGNITIEAAYNPETLSDGLTSTIAGGTTGAAGDASKNIKTFNKVNRNDLQVELLFDTYVSQGSSINLPFGLSVGASGGAPAGGNADVRDLTKPIRNLIMPTQAGKETGKPPLCEFEWKDVFFKGYITSFTEKFTLFFPDGTPARAKVNLTIVQNEKFNEALEAKGKDKCRKVRMIKQDDRLDLIAHETLQNPRLWREIVNENSSLIPNPRKFPENDQVGTMVMIPDYYKVAK